MASGTSRRPEAVDAVTVILYAVAAVVVVSLATYLRALSTFRADGIAWVVPIDEAPLQATIDSGEVPISGIARDAMVLAQDVNPVSVAAIIAAMALWAVAALLVIGAVIVIAANFLRGRFFIKANVRSLVVAGWTLVVAPIAIVMLETMGRNGVLAAIGAEEAEPAHPIEFWSIVPVFGIGVAVGLIAVAFRRGIRTQSENESLQKETEGLV